MFFACSLFLLTGGDRLPCTMATELRERTKLVERLLAALQGKPAHEQASAKQSSVFAAHLTNTRLGLSDQVELSELLAKIPWFSEKHRDDVLALCTGGRVEPVSSVQATSKTRRNLQDYGAIVNFYTEQQWAVMLSDVATPAQKLQTLVEQPHSLGLRCASETTIQKLTTVYLCVSEGAVQAKALPVSTKLAMTRHIKGELKTLGDAPPQVFLQSLPPTPQQLQVEQPTLYASVFSKSGPVPMQISLQLFAELLPSVRCRGCKAGVGPGLETTNFSQVAGQFMAQMQSMQNMQMATLQALSGRAQLPQPQRGLAVMKQGELFDNVPRLHVQHDSQSTTSGQLALCGRALDESAAGKQQLQQDKLEPEKPLQQQLHGQLHGPQAEPSATPSQPPPGQQDRENAVLPPKRARLSVTESVALINQRMGERDKERAAAAKEAKAEAKAQAKASAKALAQQPVKKDVQAGKGIAIKTKPPNGKKQKVKAEPIDEEIPIKKANPHFGIEHSRSRIQCRTGLTGPGQNVSFRFGEGFDKLAVATSKAKAWVKEQKKKYKI